MSQRALQAEASQTSPKKRQLPLHRWLAIGLPIILCLEWVFYELSRQQQVITILLGTALGWVYKFWLTLFAPTFLLTLVIFDIVIIGLILEQLNRFRHKKTIN